MPKRALTEAAKAMARRSVQSRKEKWGEEEFKKRMREWGKLGGRPKGSGKTQEKAAKKGGK